MTRLSRLLSRLLSEPVMGFLALGALTAALVPLLFSVPPGGTLVLAVVEWAIIGAFALEYLVHLALAEERWRFVSNPWRILDAFIILAPLVSLLPFASGALRSSPALRVLRLVRLIVFGARARRGLARPVAVTRHPPGGPPQVSALRPHENQASRQTWEELLRWIVSPGSAWLHAANLSAQHVKEICAAASVPQAVMEVALQGASYPRLESTQNWTTLTLSVPSGREAERDPLVVLASRSALLTVALHPLELQSPPGGFEALPWGARCVLHIARGILDRNETLAGRFDYELRALEDLSPDQSPRGFFERTFRLKRELAAAKADLWRLRGLLETLADGRRTLPGVGADHAARIAELADEAAHVHETIDKIQEALLSVLDLHLNIASHEMNRFMRLLAIVTSLALIPTIVGGLLGMNVAGNPWPVSLGQIGFGTLILMLGVLYAFMAKGWLR